MQRTFMWNSLILLLPLAGACNPASMAVKVGMYAVGKVVDSAETDKIAQEIVGQPPSAADARLGSRIDVFRDVNSSREWITYPVKMDVLHSQRYVVEVINNRIVAVEQVQASTGGTDIARKLIDEAKVKGKNPRQCQEALGGGSPLLTLRSVKTGRLTQIYDGAMIEGVGGQKYCILHFGSDGLCEKVEFVDVMASSSSGSPG